MSNFRNTWPVLLGFIAIGIIIGVVLTTGMGIDSKSVAGKIDQKGDINTQQSIASESSQSITAMPFNPSQGFVEIVKQVRPAIVTIYTTKNVKVPANPWHRFFKDFGFEDQGGNQDREFKQNGLGSGVIVSSDGYILTNHHVIKDVDELLVQLVDDREFQAEIIGTDPSTEIALIKIDADGLSPAKLGNSDNLQIGEWVLAIGSPLELNFTVTAGIVSALSRDINIIRRSSGSSSIENFIQTDAAINPGNSGGALVNNNGEVIGINTAIATPTGNYVGYGFAVPINIAKNVMNDLQKYGEIRRGYLGVYIQEVNTTIAKGVGLDKPQGVFIQSVIENSAAANAGIVAGDVVLKVNGVIVNKPNQLQAKVSAFDPGDKIDVIIWRDGKEKKFEVVLKERDEGETIVASSNKPSEENVNSLGIKVRNLTDRELSNLDLKSGILVQSVNNFNAASRSGLNNNDVIYKIDSKKVKSVAEFNDYINSLDKGAIIKLHIRTKDSGGKNFDRLVFLEIPK